MKAAIIDYGSGNLHSAFKALEAVAPQGMRVEMVTKPAALKDASHIVLPGVGAFGDCAAGLRAIDGLVYELEEQVLVNKKPFLGICVGMQLLAQAGYEHGKHQGLGWLNSEVVPIEASGNLKIPHMGWNDINIKHNHPVLDGIEEGSDFYFVHSYHMKCADEANIVAQTSYGAMLTAIIARDNIVGIQFHPEKSQQAGLKLLGNFLRF